MQGEENFQQWLFDMDIVSEEFINIFKKDKNVNLDFSPNSGVGNSLDEYPFASSKQGGAPLPHESFRVATDILIRIG